MLKLRFVRKVWNRVEEIFLHLLSDVVIIILTILALWIIGHIIKFFFPFEPETFKLIKTISELGILLVFVLYIVDIVDYIYKVISKVKIPYEKMLSFHAIYQVFLNIFAIILDGITMYLINQWFSVIVSYIIFIFIFFLYYFGIRMIYFKIIINKLTSTINNLVIRRALESAIETEDAMRFRKLLIQNAVNKVKYGDANEKLLGIIQLEQLSEEFDHFESEYTYKALLSILKSESEGVYAKLIIKIINKIQK